MKNLEELKLELEKELEEIRKGIENREEKEGKAEIIITLDGVEIHNMSLAEIISCLTGVLNSLYSEGEIDDGDLKFMFDNARKPIEQVEKEALEKVEKMNKINSLFEEFKNIIEK